RGAVTSTARAASARRTPASASRATGTAAARGPATPRRPAQLGQGLPHAAAVGIGLLPGFGADVLVGADPVLDPSCLARRDDPVLARIDGSILQLLTGEIVSFAVLKGASESNGSSHKKGPANHHSPP